MQNFSKQELADMHFVYGYCNGSSLAAVQEYRRRFPLRRIPTRKVIERTHRNLVENGSFDRLRGQGRPMGDYNFNNALQEIEENPQIGLRPLATHVNIPRSIVMHIVSSCYFYIFNGHLF
jgi:hypothetical protein